MTFRIRSVLFGLACAGTAGFGCSGQTGNDFPESCKDVQDQAISDTGKRPADGTYTLYVKGNEASPWQAFCRRMNLNEPTEYLTVTDSENYSTISNGRYIAKTTYRRYRIDPTRLEINPLDDAFSSNENFDKFTPEFPSEVSWTHIPAGWAEFQPTRPDDGPAAEANVSLKGTAFVFSEDVLANNLNTFFCPASDPQPTLTNASDSGASVSADLATFHLTAINDDRDSGAEGSDPADIKTREVADCENLGTGATNFATAAWPLQYSAE